MAEVAAQMSPEQYFATLEQLAKVDVTSFAQHPTFATDRRKALIAARQLHHNLETPFELSMRVGWQESTLTVTLQIALDMGVLQGLSAESPNSVTVQALAEKAKQPQELVERILRHLSASDVVKQTGHKLYAATPKSNGFLDPSVASGLNFWINIASTSLPHLPKYLREGRYPDRMVPGKGNFEIANGTGLGLFPWMNQNPDVLHNFHLMLERYRVGRVEWIDLYPVKERILDGADETGPLVIDIGGGIGKAVQVFQDQFPQGPGRLMVQDQANVLAQAKVDPVITLQPHDFLTAQPVIGARAYLLQFILHDWSVDECMKILEPIGKAMKRGYSKLLVSENVLAAQNPDVMTTSLEWMVMSLLGANEHTEEDWHALFKKAGMKIENTYMVSGFPDCVFEVVLDDE